jgi:hypothetical protein
MGKIPPRREGEPSGPASFSGEKSKKESFMVKLHKHLNLKMV